MSDERTVGIELEYCDALAGAVAPRLPPKWSWSLEWSVRNSDGLQSGIMPGVTRAKQHATPFTQGGEVKTNPYLTAGEVRSSVEAVCTLLRDEGATFNQTTGLQVHVGSRMPKSAATVGRAVGYVRAFAPSLWTLAACTEYRRTKWARAFDGPAGRFGDWCGWEPGVIEWMFATNSPSKKLHPNMPVCRKWEFRAHILGLVQLWRLGTIELRLWEASHAPEQILDAVSLALAIADDLEGWDGSAVPADHYEARLKEGCAQWISRI